MKNRNRRYLRKALVLAAAALVLGALGALLIRGGQSSFRQASHPRKYSEYVEYYGGKYSLDPLLLYAFICTESGFDPDATSDVDARGLMQITEATFGWIKSKIAPDEPLEFEDLYDPETNVRFGSYYIYCCLDRYGGDIPTAAAAYHSGWGTVDELLGREEYTTDGKLTTYPYTQMRQYVAKIQRNYDIYQELYGEETQ